MAIQTDDANANKDTAGVPDEQMPEVPTLALSWRRCNERGLPRDLRQPLPISGADITPVLDSALASYLALIRPAMEDVYQFIEGTPSVIGFCDANARLLDIIGSQRLLDELTAHGLGMGACWSEECVGTNGVALSLLDSFPTQVNGASHFCDLLTPYCTASAPVYDSLGGLIGALIAITYATDANTYLLGMMSAAASALTTELRMNLWLGSANELLSEMTAILHTLSEGILLLQADGTISQMNARAGHLLGLAPLSAAGHRLAEMVEVPAMLADALRLGRELHDEEIIFHGRGERIACLCTLRAIVAPTTPAPMTLNSPSAESAEIWRGVGNGPGNLGSLGNLRQPGTALSVTPRATASGFVLTMRSIERVQRLVHRMSGAHALMRFENIIGQSPQLLEAVRLARIAAESHSTVLLHGETGTGKEVFAQSIHNGSARASGPFVAINCAAIPRELISSELFGYEGGAFTGADRHGRPGKFELANGGTLFLDEIGDMPLDLQTSLLRAIETRAVVRVGGQQVTPVDVRIIAATHKDLAEGVHLGTFRSDLFFRLNVFPIEVPALRARSGDIALLLRYVLQRLSTRLNRALSIEADAFVALEAYDWPGNVRELENVIERAVYIAERGVVSRAELPEEIRSTSARIGHVGRAVQSTQSDQVGAIETAPVFATAAQAARGLARGLRYESENAEAALILRTLRAHNGNVAQAAATLGISRTTLWRKKRRYRL